MEMSECPMLLLGDLLPSLKFKSFVTMPASTEADSNWRDLPIFKLGMREHLDGPPCRACGHFPISVTSRCLAAGLCDELSLWEIRVVVHWWRMSERQMLPQALSLRRKQLRRGFLSHGLKRLTRLL